MLAASSAVREVTELLAQLSGLVVLGGTLAALAAFLYRWYVREQIPGGLSLLFGLAGVTVYLNTSRALGQVIGGSTLPTETEVALFNIIAFGLATGGAVLGRRVGDRFGTDVALRSGIDGVEKDVGRLVQSVGRVIAVELPEEIDDVVGYDPVPEETKESLAGKSFLFPRRLTVEELRSRLVSRLKSDYAVGHVDIELGDDGAVEYIALGSRPAGIGPTLPPATNAVALRADPAFAASAGDLVQVWETGPTRRVLTAELRGVAEDTVTVAIDAADTPKVDPTKRYRLVTLPVDDRPDREFASLLRAADETFSSVTVEAGSPLHGLPVGALGLTVVVVKPEDGQPVALPERTHTLAPGDTVFAIARPEALRRLERAAEALDPSLAPREGLDAGVASDESGEAATGAPGGDAPSESEPGPDAAVEGGRADASPVGESTEGPDDPDSDEGDERTQEGDTADDEGREAGGADTGDRPGGRTADIGDGVEGHNFGVEGEDSADDDLAALDVGEPDDGLDLEGDVGFGEGADEAGDTEEGDAADEKGDTEGDEEERGTDDESDGGAGGKSFQELKEEFESGDADWDDDVSDSPGGDMRLDE